MAQSERISAWQWAAVAPTGVGSLLALVALLGGLGAWAGMVVVGWVAVGPVLLTRRGERSAVRLACRFRRATPQHMQVLAREWANALQIAQLEASDVDLYVHNSRDVNAFATGSRSVALTGGLISDVRGDRVGAPQLLALMLHELGHLETRSTRLALMTAWWSAPWSLLSCLVMTPVLRIARWPTVLVAVAGAALATGKALEAHRWGTALFISALTWTSLVCPLIDAAVSRRAEFLADRYAASLGFDPQLEFALELVGSSRHELLGLTERIRAHHPCVARRVARIHAADLPATRSCGRPRANSRHVTCGALITLRPMEQLAAAAARPKRSPASPTQSHRDAEYGSNGMVFAGGPDEIADRILSLHGKLGHTRQILQMDVGRMPHATYLHAVELLGTRVLPRIREELGSP